MKTEVIDRNGVVLAGPDSPALAPEGSVVLAPVGGVSRAQAGILDYASPAQRDTLAYERGSGVSVEMIDRGHAAAPGLSRETIEDIVNAALGLRKHPHTGA